MLLLGDPHITAMSNEVSKFAKITLVFLPGYAGIWVITGWESV